MPVNNFVYILPSFFSLYISFSELQSYTHPVLNLQSSENVYCSSQNWISCGEKGRRVLVLLQGTFTSPSFQEPSSFLLTSLSFRFQPNLWVLSFCHIAVKLEARRGRESLFSKKQRAFKDETLSCAVRSVISAQVRKHTRCVQVALCEHEGVSSKTVLHGQLSASPSPKLSPSHQHLNFEAKLVKLNDNVDGGNPAPPRGGVVVVRNQVLYR